MKLTLNQSQITNVYKELHNTSQGSLKNLSQDERTVCKKIAEYMKNKGTTSLELDVPDDFTLDNMKRNFSQATPPPSNFLVRLGKGIANCLWRVSSQSLYESLHPESVAQKQSQKPHPMRNEMNQFLDTLPLNDEFKAHLLTLDTTQQAKVLRDIVEDVIVSRGDIPKDSVNTLKFAHDAVHLLIAYLQNEPKESSQNPEIIAIATTCDEAKIKIISYLQANYSESCKKIEDKFIGEADHKESFEIAGDLNKMKLTNYEKYISPTVDLILKEKEQKAKEPLKMPEFKINEEKISADFTGFKYQDATHPFNKEQLLQVLRQHAFTTAEDGDLMRRVEADLSSDFAEKVFYGKTSHTPEDWAANKAELLNKIKSNSQLDLSTIKILARVLYINMEHTQGEFRMQHAYLPALITIKLTPDGSQFQVGETKRSLFEKSLREGIVRLALEPQPSK